MDDAACEEKAAREEARSVSNNYEIPVNDLQEVLNGENERHYEITYGSFLSSDSSLSANIWRSLATSSSL